MSDLAKVNKDSEDLLKPTRHRFWRGTLVSLAAAIDASFAFASTAPTSVATSAPALAHLR
jgi:hypothetical protein